MHRQSFARHLPVTAKSVENTTTRSLSRPTLLVATGRDRLAEIVGRMIIREVPKENPGERC
jgi:hypothetical protein